VLESRSFSEEEAGAERFEGAPDASELLESGISAEAWVLCRASEAVGMYWSALTTASMEGGNGPKVVASHDALPAGPGVADLAFFASVPRGVVAAPADAESAAAAVEAAARHVGPAYVRVPRGPVPPTSNGTFGFARAPQLRDGSDLTIIGVGPCLGEVRALAERLHAVGIEARVLDGASVKPLDASTIVRAARETGALLTVEEHHALTGLGAMVAALVASTYPVPIRRVGYPDLPATPLQAVPGPAGFGVSSGRLDEEAWELLRARGKVQ